MADDPGSIEARLLFLSANANDQSPISVDREYSRVKGALVTIGAWPAWRLCVEHQPAVEWEQVPELLQLYRPSIVHFAGHGYPDGSLELAKHDGGRERISTHGLAKLLASHAHEVRLVVLNACYSDELASALTEHVDAVIGMTYAIPDAAAILFAPAFYRSLAGSESIQSAFDVGSAMVLGLDPSPGPAGKRDVVAEQVDKAATPQLRVRPGVDASRMRFSPPAAPSSPVRTPGQRPSWSSRRLVAGACAAALAAGGALWVWLDGKTGEPFEMVYIAGGTVDAAAVPGFWIAKTELSQGLWESITGQNPSDARFGLGPHYPVNNVTWDKAIDTANKLSLRYELGPCYERRDDRWWKIACTGYRLVTDFEWRYLKMRAGMPTSPCTVANVADRSLAAAPDLLADLKTVPGFATIDCDDHFTLLAPVGSLAPDALGIYDLEGNVAEWIWNGTATDPATPVVRGSSFLGGGQDEASQIPLGREVRNAAIGVRYARDPQ